MTLVMAAGTDEGRDEMSPDGTGETTIVGDEIAGATTETVIGGRGSATIASETRAGGIEGMTIDGEVVVSETTIGAIALLVEFNIGIAGGEFFPLTGHK
jgi:hypothetical protein